MKRILFVDDEPLVLQALQRMLRGMRKEWDMHFVESGAKALEMMAENPFDVVISDMRMPGMTGAELHNELMARYPKTVRLILSGHADRELVMKCLGSTHQYLAKPCDPETLRLTIARASMLHGTLHSEQLAALVARLDRLPSLPSLYTEVVNCLQSADISMEQVGTIISRDIGMAAQVLKLVNSAFFGLPRHITTPEEAASYLGADILKALVLGFQVFEQFERVPVKGFSLEGLWTHSLRTADMARTVARLEEATPSIVSEAFTAGLLHDLGKVVLVSNFPNPYSEVLERASAEKRSLSDVEREVFGASHAEVGGHLLGLWGLQPSIVEAVTLHHSPPEDNPIDSFSPLTATYAGNLLAHDLAADSRLPPDDPYLRARNLEARFPIWRSAALRNPSDGPGFS